VLRDTISHIDHGIPRRQALIVDDEALGNFVDSFMRDSARSRSYMILCVNTAR
jgi:hypothetical protein